MPSCNRANASAGCHGFTDDQQLLRLAPYPPCRNDRKFICRPGSRHRHRPISITDLEPSEEHHSSSSARRPSPDGDELTSSWFMCISVLTHVIRDANPSYSSCGLIDGRPMGWHA